VAGAKAASLRDGAAAAPLYEKGCERGSAAGCRRLAEQYARGHGVPKDAVKARWWFAKACGAGDAASCDDARRDQP
jgi:TPR repeat protein